MAMDIITRDKKNIKWKGFPQSREKVCTQTAPNVYKYRPNCQYIPPLMSKQTAPNVDWGLPPVAREGPSTDRP